jgi:Sec-independent protein translocase protein TatA
MRKQQDGVSIMGLLIVLVLVIVLALFGMKVIPSVMEYRTAKQAIQGVARSGATTPQDVRRGFENRATIDNITSVRPQDLEITRDGNSVVIAFAYRKEIPLFTGVGLYLDFAANSRD